MRSPAATATLLRVAVNEPEMLFIDQEARAAGLSIANFIRQKLGFRARPMGRPTAAQLEQMEDDAWDLLTRVGADPTQYFPPEPPQAPSEDEETREEHDARIARLRAVFASVKAR